MAGTITWNSGTSSFALLASGQGGALNSGAATQLSGIIDNTGASGGPYFFALPELFLSASGWASGVNANSTVDFYLVPARDNTNYMDVDVTNNSLPAPHFRGSFVPATSGNNGLAHYGIENVPLMPFKYKAYLANKAAPLTSGWSAFITLVDEAYT